LRFAVHGPGNPVASPRSHGMPCRDVLGRIHVGVAGVSARGAPEDGLALARLPVHMPARRASLARERRTNLLHSAGRLFLQSPHQEPPSGPQDAPVRAPLCAGEPALQPPQPVSLPAGQARSAGLLLHGLGARRQPRVLGSGGGQLTTLLHVGRCAGPARMPVRVLLDGKVPYVPGVCAVVPQHSLLGGGGEQPVTRHANTLSTATDISEEVTRRSLPRMTAWSSTPRL
jgi:hypothetical protein